MKKKTVILALCWCVSGYLLLTSLISISYAADFYVDAAKGSDKNSGRTENSAWKTLKRVNSADLKSGDHVLFKRGEVWRGTLRISSGSKQKPIIYASYGSDRKFKPRIIGSVDLSNPNAWLPAGENLWRTVPDRVNVSDRDVKFAHRNWTLHCDGGAEAGLKTVVSDDGLKLFRLTCRKRGTKASQIQLYNHSFAVKGGQAYVYRFRARATIPFSDVRVSLMMAARPWCRYGTVTGETQFGEVWKEFEIVCQSDADAQDGRLTFFLGKGIPEGCVFDFVPLGVFEAEVVSLGLNADIGNVILAENNESRKSAAFKRWALSSVKSVGDFYSDPLSPSPSSGPRTLYFYAKRNPAEVYGFIEAALKKPTAFMRHRRWFIIDGLAFGYTAAHGINGAAVKNAVIRNCDFFWIGGGHLYTRKKKIPVRYGNGVEFWCTADNNLVENCRFWQIYDAAMTNQGRNKCSVRNMVWRNNVIYLCEQAYEVWLSHKESTVESLLYEGNRSYDCGFGWGHIQRPNKNGTHLLAYKLKAAKININYRNNVFCNATDTLIWFFNARLNEINCNNNVYCQDGSDPENQKLFMWKGQEMPGVSFNEYRIKTGNDSSSRFEQIKRIKYFDY